MRSPSSAAAALALLGLLAAGAGAAPKDKKDKSTPKKEESDRRLTTTTYEVADLLDKAESWNPSGRDKDPTAALARVIMTVNPDLWRAKEDPATLAVVNGTRMEIRTTPGHHEEIAQMLRALRRMADVSVIVHSQFYEVDRDFYKKEVEPKLAKSWAVPAAGEDVWEKELSRRGEKVRGGKVMAANGKETALLSLREAALLRTRPAAREVFDDGGFEAVLSGVSFQALPVVSADRRFVRLRLVRQVTELVEVRKEKARVPGTDKETTVEVPVLAEAATTTTLKLEDGQALLVQVPYQPRAVRERGRVLVLLVRPEIYILEEATERAGNKG
jgi:hypothetical protein